MLEKKMLAKWVDPVIETLDVEETNLQPRVGFDGGAPFPDCTHS